MSVNRHSLPAIGLLDRHLSPHDPRGSSGPLDEQANSTHRALRAGTAALLLVIGVVHLHLWLDGYRNLSTIGPLFLVAVVSAVALAIVAAVRINAVIAVAAASFAAGTLAANILSLLLPDGLFHFKEIGVSYSGGFALASEVGVVVLMGISAHKRFRHGHRQVMSERRELVGRPI